MTLRDRGESLTMYFEDNDLYNIAIYGLGALGIHLYEELREGKVSIEYGIDQNASGIKVDGLDIKTLEDRLPRVDAVVVTPIAFYEIEKKIQKKMGKEVAILFIEDVVDYCFGK
jgi:hypothetical protein